MSPLPAFDLPASLRLQARANRLANLRLQDAMTPLSREDLHAPRTSFFPSLMQTLNHILAVDEYYVGTLEGRPGMAAGWAAFVDADDVVALRPRQAAVDERLIAVCDGLDAAGCAAPLVLDRGSGKLQHDVVAPTLLHLLMHQTHHRGQVHAMLAGTAVKPPQLDEFLMFSDGHYRVREMAALGWDEATLFGAPRAG